MENGGCNANKDSKGLGDIYRENSLGIPERRKDYFEDNLNTHKPASWYETFPPEKAKALMDKFELVYTPKHGSWLNMAEIELNAVSAQCLKKRIASIEEMKNMVNAWEKERNEKTKTINWQFSTADARVKLHRLYPSFQI